MEGIKKRIISICLAFCLFISSGMNLVSAETADKNKAAVYVDRLADVVFVIDGTGSMQDDIDSVKTNLSTFIDLLRQDGVNVRVRFSVYRDATISGQETQVSDWFKPVNDSGALDVNALNDAKQYLEDITASGGPRETILNGYGKVLMDNPEFRDGAAKFVIALTDEDYYVDPNDTAYTLEKVLDTIAAKSIYSSVVTLGSLFEKYSKFVTKSAVDSEKEAGIFDIKGDYAILLKDLAEDIIDVLDDDQAVKIGANMIVLKKKPGQKFSIDGGPKQDSCVFKDLEPNTEYTFTVTDPKAGDIQFKLTTEEVTGAQMGKIPSIVYEGETYQIRPNENMRTMLETPEAKINWSSSSDCLKVTNNKVGNGCEMKVYDCKYNNEKLIKVTLTADIEYSVWQRNGTYKMKSARIKQNFSVKNTVDAIKIVNFHGTSDNTYTGGVIQLLTTEKVWMDVEFNQGDIGDVASKQKLKYYISDQYGNPNTKAKKIAKVTAKGELTGVGAGLTYLTIAPNDCYNKYSKIYKYFAVIPISCPFVTGAEFNLDKAVKDKPSIVAKQTSENNVYAVKKGESLDLKEYINYKPDVVFNADKMKCSWSLTDRSAASISSSGIIKFRNEGYVTVSMTPTGGYEIDAATGQKMGNILPCSVMFKVVEDLNAK